MSVEQETVNSPYILLINTNKYAGNFERELTAYVTGAVGECNVGSTEAEVFEAEVPAPPEDQDTIAAITNSVSDGTCYRPCSIWNDGDEYKTVAIFFYGEPTAEELLLMLERAKKYPEYARSIRFGKQAHEGLEIIGMRLIKRELKVTDTVITCLQ